MSNTFRVTLPCLSLLLAVMLTGAVHGQEKPLKELNWSHAFDLACRQQQVGEGHFPNMEAVPQYAFTLTIPMLCSAKRMLCVAPEKRKAKAVTNTLQGPIHTDCPASFLRRQSQATLFLDAESASGVMA